MTPDERFVGWNDAVNQNWMTILEGSGDGIWIPDAEDYGLNQGFPAPPNEKHQDNKTDQFYHISNLHQLHCLNIMRMAHYSRIEDLEWLSDDGKKQAAYHFEHCVEYLRLTIMCGDSLVVEANSPPGSPASEAVDAWGKPLGWGITKQCINWENLRQWQRYQLEAWKKA
ncbi:hypothetical protein LZ31DRAFT_475432 [Colletotrichum somersetense]|nr:hypothetical protein LZ31DRAFT_475432 [Colletotrichum somersetense]